MQHTIRSQHIPAAQSSSRGTWHVGRSPDERSSDEASLCKLYANPERPHTP